MSKKNLDKSLLPQPEQVLGWKNRTLKINTSDQNMDLDRPLIGNRNFNHAKNQQNSFANRPNHTPRNNAPSNNNPNNQLKYSQQSQQNFQTPQRMYQTTTFSNNNSNTKQYDSVNPNNNSNANNFNQNRNSVGQPLNPANKMTSSQYSLQQKQLLTFAAGQSNQNQSEQFNQYYQNNNKYYSSNKKENNNYSGYQQQNGPFSTIQRRSPSQSISTTMNPNRNNYMMSSQQISGQKPNSNVRIQQQQSQINILTSQSNYYTVNNESPSSKNNNLNKSRSKNKKQQQRSSSKNKQHKTKIYQHFIKQKEEEFVAYSVIIKESKSGMFTNQKFLVLNTLSRQLMYYSKLPKYLPFQSYIQMKALYFDCQEPKETIDIDKVRKFTFLPSKNNIAQIDVTYLSENNERKSWKLNMGTNSNMNDWMELVNQVVKKQHYAVVKSQIKYPPKPKKQPENKPIAYQSAFTKNLKQQVVPKMKQSNSGAKPSNNNNNLNTSNATLSKSKQKQYIVDKSKFVNTKTYLIDLQDVQQDDIFYEPPPKVIEQPSIINQSNMKSQQLNESRRSKNQQTNSNTNTNNNQNINISTLPVSSNTKQQPKSNITNKPVISSNYIQSPHSNSKFNQELARQQKLMNAEHQNRIKVEMADREKERNNNSMGFNNTNNVNSPPAQQLSNLLLLRRNSSSGQRISQTTHKDLNINIDSRLLTNEDYEQYMRQQQQKKMMSQSFKKKSKQEQYQYENGTGSGGKNFDVDIPTTLNGGKKLNFNQNNKNYYEEDPIVGGNNNKGNRSTYENVRGNYVNNESIIVNEQYEPRRRGYTQDPNFQSSSNYNVINDHKKRNSIDNGPNRQNTNPSPNRRQNTKPVSTPTSKSEIQEVWIGKKLQQGYILNFNPNSSNNNWFRLWLQSSSSFHKLEIYISFIKTCSTLCKKLIESPSTYIPTSSFTQNNTHLLFTMQHITFKLPYKLSLPSGLGQFITLIDFIRSEQFYSNILKHQAQIQNQYKNYIFILNHLLEQFNNSNDVLSIPVNIPMCCLVEYKGVKILCKASMESSNLKVHKMAVNQYQKYENQLEYIEEKCHMRLSNNNNNNELGQYQLYQIYLPSFNKSVLYMDNLKQYLPKISNPLNNTSSAKRTIQINQKYIDQYVKRGIINPNSQKKDILQIQKHINHDVVKYACEKAIRCSYQVSCSDQLIVKVFQEVGLMKEWLGEVYNGLERYENVGRNKRDHIERIKKVILTEIVLIEFMKICRLFFMKEFNKDLTNSIQNYYSSSQYSSSNKKSTGYQNQNKQFSHSSVSNHSKTIKNLQHHTPTKNQPLNTNKFSSNHLQFVTQIIHCIMYKNTKIWNVLLFVLKQKYHIEDFQLSYSNQQQRQRKSFSHNTATNTKIQIDKVYQNIDIKYLMLNLFNKLNVTVELKIWKFDNKNRLSNNTKWQNFIMSQQTMTISQSVPKIQSFSLNVFRPQFKSFIQKLQIILNKQAFLYSPTPSITKPKSSCLHNTSYQINNQLYQQLFQILNLCQQYNKQQSHIIKSFQYQLLQLNASAGVHSYEKCLIDWILSYFVPPTSGVLSKNNHMSNYQSSGSGLWAENCQHLARVRDPARLLNGIKWLIKQKQYEKVCILLQEQLQSMEIWIGDDMLETKIKYYDLAALFYYKKMWNRNQLGIDYSMRSLEIVVEMYDKREKSTFFYELCAQKAYQAANIHFELQYYEKSLQLYELTQKYLQKSQKLNLQHRTPKPPSKNISQSIQYINIYIKKSKIKLYMGKTSQTLYECLQCLKRCQQFSQIIQLFNLNQDSPQFPIDKQSLCDQLEIIQINVFEIILRCYQITHNYQQMKKIVLLCCNKFIQDNFLAYKRAHFNKGVIENDDVKCDIVEVILKYCWICIVNQLGDIEEQNSKGILEGDDFAQKTYITIPQRQIGRTQTPGSSGKKLPISKNRLPSYNISQLKQKLQALCKLYPKNRYNKQNLTNFLYQQILQNHNTQKHIHQSIQKNLSRNQYYQVVGQNNRGYYYQPINSIESLMNKGQRINRSYKSNQQNDCESVLFNNIFKIIKELAGSGAGYRTVPRTNNESDNYRYSTNDQYNDREESNSNKRYSTNTVSYNNYNSHQNRNRFSSNTQVQRQRRSSRQKKYYNQNDQQTSQYSHQSNIGKYQMYSLKDEMDRKYMLVEAMFGICGREFMIGELEAVMMKVKRNGKDEWQDLEKGYVSNERKRAVTVGNVRNNEVVSSEITVYYQ